MRKYTASESTALSTACNASQMKWASKAAPNSRNFPANPASGGISGSDIRNIDIAIPRIGWVRFMPLQASNAWPVR